MCTRGAIHGLTRQLCVDYGSRGVRFNCVSPGAIDTALNAHSQAICPELQPLGAQGEPISPGDMPGQLEGRTKPALFRSGQPVHCAHAIVFLLSDDAMHINGHDLVIDGGASIAGDIRRVPGIS